ncbi:hypothetical protein ACOSQ4_002412 [Xanthoceras sorbifolium]
MMSFLPNLLEDFVACKLWIICSVSNSSGTFPLSNGPKRTEKNEEVTGVNSFGLNFSLPPVAFKQKLKHPTSLCIEDSQEYIKVDGSWDLGCNSSDQGISNEVDQFSFHKGRFEENCEQWTESYYFNYISKMD